jgi:hypothetical protein
MDAVGADIYGSNDAWRNAHAVTMVPRGKLIFRNVTVVA